MEIPRRVEKKTDVPGNGRRVVGQTNELIPTVYTRLVTTFRRRKRSTADNSDTVTPRRRLLEFHPTRGVRSLTFVTTLTQEQNCNDYRHRSTVRSREILRDVSVTKVNFI